MCSFLDTLGLKLNCKVLIKEMALSLKGIKNNIHLPPATPPVIRERVGIVLCFKLEFHNPMKVIYNLMKIIQYQQSFRLLLQTPSIFPSD